MDKFYANKAYGQHMSQLDDEDNARPEGAGQEEQKDFDQTDAADKPDIMIQSHSGGTTMHVMPKGGAQPHSKDFEHGEHDAVGEAVKDHLSGAHQDDAGQEGAAQLEPTTSKKLNVNRPA